LASPQPGGTLLFGMLLFHVGGSLTQALATPLSVKTTPRGWKGRSKAPALDCSRQALRAGLAPSICVEWGPMEFTTLEVSGSGAVCLLDEYRSRYRSTAQYPFMIGDAEELERLEEQAEDAEQRAAEIIQASLRSMLVRGSQRSLDSGVKM
jgi:hypothetical protein